MKAMEHLQNISQAQGDQRVPLTHQGMDGAMSAVNRTVDATNGVISVVVVPLLQNAFELTEPGRTSVSQLAARNPVVLTRTDKDGNHTTIHVVRAVSIWYFENSILFFHINCSGRVIVTIP